jgi:hypothetical protein
MNYYLNKFNIQYKLKSVIKQNDKYELCEYYEPNLEKYKKLINIYQPKNSRVEEFQINENKMGMFSSSWYNIISNDKNIEHIINLKLDINNYKQNILKKCKRENTMWTVYKVYQEKIIDNTTYIDKNTKEKKNITVDTLYNKNFAACSLRATNVWDNKTNLFYLINRYMAPTIRNNYFQYQNVNDDGYALSEMIQWIWRSAIRNDQPINIFIPSVRMRKILIKWLNNEVI